MHILFHIPTLYVNPIAKQSLKAGHAIMKWKVERVEQWNKKLKSV